MISEAAFKSAERATGGASIEKGFWTSQAETFLGDFIWNDGDVPAGGKLVLKGADHDSLEKLAHQEEENE